MYFSEYKWHTMLAPSREKIMNKSDHLNVGTDIGINEIVQYFSATVKDTIIALLFHGFYFEVMFRILNKPQ